MEKVVFKKAVTGGEITLPPSKSVAHRAMICAALANGNSVIENIDNSKDMIATMNFLKAIGKKICYENKCLKISGEINIDETEIDCIESGSTLRFVIPVMAALGVKTKFTGSGRLPQRPIGVYTEILKGLETRGEGLPFFIDGKLKSGEFSIRGDISSQFISGLLFALPLLEGDSKIILTTKLESESYVNITIDVMAQFGVFVERTDYGYSVKGSQEYKAQNYTVEGDWSQAAFFMSMAAFCENEITLNGLRWKSQQGDKECFEVFRHMFVELNYRNKNFVAKKPSLNLQPIEIDVSNIPDMVPALACTLALANGTSKITGARRLRLKESDRLMAISKAINALGGKVSELEDGLIIEGVKTLKGGTVNAYNDHRILMAVSALRAVCTGDIEISDPHCVEKSYPDFYKDYEKLGGIVNVINVG